MSMPASRNAHFTEGLGRIRAVGEHFAAQHFAGQAPDYAKVFIHPTATRRMANAYSQLPIREDRAVPHFNAMLNDTRDQFEALVRPKAKGGLGLSVHVQDTDPYAGPEEMRHDVLNNNRIHVLSTKVTGGHPVLGDEGNDMFRAVHDVFGHVGSGRGFDRHGEEAAFVSHARMFSPLAKPALVSETRGQNSFFNTFGHFPDQKVALMPRQFHNAAPMTEGNKTGRRAAMAQARTFHRRQFSPIAG